MIVKFFRHGTGSGSGPINYLLGKDRDREDAKVLHGDPNITEQLINTTKHQQKYKSGVLSFEEQASKFTDAQKQDIMQRFEKTLFVGLEPDQYDILWVEHSDKGGRLELNFLIPGQELRTGKRLQPFYAGADLVRVNAFKNIINHEYKLSDPNDPSRKRLANPYIDNGPRPQEKEENGKGFTAEKTKITRQTIKSDVDQILVGQLERGNVRNRSDVLRELNQAGYTVERATKSSISVSTPKFNGNIRLKGAMYQDDFNAIHHKDHIIEHRQRAFKELAPKNYQKDLKTWQKGLEIKESYHKELYSAEVPKPYDLSSVEPEQAPEPVQEPIKELEQTISNDNLDSNNFSL